MKLLRRVISVTMVFCLMMSFMGYASSLSWEDIPGNYNESVLLEEEVSSKNEYHGVRRGEFLSGASTQIVNGQDGTITINIDTYAHHDVDEVFHTAFLDVWKDDTSSWSTVGKWDFELPKEDTEDGTVSQLNSSITLSGYTTNRYYRVRGLHGVRYNGDTEACATQTDGVLITNGPT